MLIWISLTCVRINQAARVEWIFCDIYFVSGEVGGWWQTQNPRRHDHLSAFLPACLIQADPEVIFDRSALFLSLFYFVSWSRSRGCCCCREAAWFSYARGESCRRTERRLKGMWPRSSRRRRRRRRRGLGQVSRCGYERSKQKVPGQKVEQRIKSPAKGGVQLGNCFLVFVFFFCVQEGRI